MGNLVLTGFMGSGKTSVSKELSKLTGMKAVDTDQMVEKKSGKKISRIFAEKGEEYFRGLESAAAKKAASMKNVIIATGGGIIKKPENIKALRKTGTVIFLKNSFAVSAKRLKNKKDRPLFMQDKIGQARELYKGRLPLYIKQADIIINTDRKTIRQAAEEIIRKTAGDK